MELFTWSLVALALLIAVMGLRLVVTGNAPPVKRWWMPRAHEVADVRALGWGYVAQGILLAIVIGGQGVADRIHVAFAVILGAVAVVALGAMVFFMRRAGRRH
ncbi:hypothetical protein H7X46_07700 [Pseudonocardia sp. C8]|nr:hypothetical protein [Pseudonocardia sp. C8]